MILKLTGTQGELQQHMEPIHRMIEAIQASVGGKLHVQAKEEWFGETFTYIWQIGPTKPPPKVKTKYRETEKLDGRLGLPPVGLPGDFETYSVRKAPAKGIERPKPFALLPPAEEKPKP